MSGCCSIIDATLVSVNTSVSTSVVSAWLFEPQPARKRAEMMIRVAIFFIFLNG